MTATTLVRSTPVQGLIRGSSALAARRFKQHDAIGIQRRMLRELLFTARHTKFGRDHGFDNMAALPFEQAYRTYCRQVPIRSYQDFWRDYFRPHSRMEGATLRGLDLDNITWPGRIGLFCETSGTTSPSKYIPFSTRMFAENRRAALDLISCYLTGNRGSKATTGKILYMSGSTMLNDLGNGVFSGDMSAITLAKRPKILAPFVEPSQEISALPWEERLEEMARLVLTDPEIRVISGVPPWILLLLKRCMEMGGKPLAELVPHLELIIHGGTSLHPYRAEFESLFNGHLPHFLEVLPSSEAFMGFQAYGDTLMRLTPYYGVFFEFVPVDCLDAQGNVPPDAPAIPLEQVELGQRYGVILSTCAGLWRYHIGDTLRFTGRNPWFIEFTGRDRFLDKLEEKVTQGEVERAVALLNDQPGWRVGEFMVGADTADRRHLWVLALEEQGGDPAQAGHLLDEALRSQNADYDTFRRQGRIREPEVVCTSGEMVYEWSRTVRGKLGGQTKIPHIDPTMDGSMIRSLREYVVCACQLYSNLN